VAAVRLHDQTHGASLEAGLTRLWRDGQSCDITIRVPAGLADGAAPTVDAAVAVVEVEAHRIVLAAVSAPLDRMIFGPMASVDEENVLTLADGIEPAALRSVVEYAYSGTLEITQDTMWAVLKACLYLEMRGAVLLCTQFFAEQLTPATVLGVAKAAEALHCPELEAAALAFLKKHTAATLKGVDWLALSPKEQALFARAVGSPGDPARPACAFLVDGPSFDRPFSSAYMRSEYRRCEGL